MEQYEINWKDYYTILGINIDTEDEVIKAAYFALARKYHPDRSSVNARRMKEINEAYECFSSPQRKAAYDRIYLANKQNARPGQAPPKASSVQPPQPCIYPPHEDIGALVIGDRRTVYFNASNAGGPASNTVLEYHPDADWINISTNSDNLPFRIEVEINTAALPTDQAFQVQVSLVLDGTTASSSLYFRTAHATYNQQSYATAPPKKSQKTATVSTANNQNKIFPWPAWGWQRAALIASFPVGLMLLVESHSGLVWAGLALLIAACVGAIGTKWLTDTTHSGIVPRFAAGTSIGLTLGSGLIAAAVSALFIAAILAALAMAFIILSAAFSSKG